ncbi:MAG: glutaredoxin family protein [candidate division Zixibacteria bacterium]|nr:glutaredoxin family protein [candidate division Zixibacteria bacterium]
MTEVTIYTKDGCPYCAAAKKHYTDNGIKFKEIDINKVDSAQGELLKLSGGQRIVPVIVEKSEVKLGFGGG